MFIWNDTALDKPKRGNLIMIALPDKKMLEALLMFETRSVYTYYLDKGMSMHWSRMRK